MAGHVFRPSASELQEGVMVVEYSVVQDRYDMAMCQLNFVRTSIGSKTLRTIALLLFVETFSNLGSSQGQGKISSN